MLQLICISSASDLVQAWEKDFSPTLFWKSTVEKHNNRLPFLFYNRPKNIVVLIQQTTKHSCILVTVFLWNIRQTLFWNLGTLCGQRQMLIYNCKACTQALHVAGVSVSVSVCVCLPVHVFWACWLSVLLQVSHADLCLSIHIFGACQWSCVCMWCICPVPTACLIIPAVMHEASCPVLQHVFACVNLVTLELLGNG